jgi:hypothetical protein
MRVAAQALSHVYFHAIKWLQYPEPVIDGLAGFWGVRAFF